MHKAPAPHALEMTPEPFPFRLGEKEPLQIPASWPNDSAIEVLERRQSLRRFGALSREDLGKLLWFGARVKDLRTLPSGHTWQHRTSPSAGGRHPFDILVLQEDSGRAPLLYDPAAHCLVRIESASPTAGSVLAERVSEIVPSGAGTILWLICQPHKTASKYANPESLIWRDAGALLTTLSITAEALGLASCLVGDLGSDWVADSFSDTDLFGAGGCVVGSIYQEEPNAASTQEG